RGVQGVWETRFGVAGAALQPLPGLDLVFGYLIGQTSTHTNDFSGTVSAWYPLASYRYGPHRLTARYDGFRVDDLDVSPTTRESGHAVTVAYLFEFWLRHRIAVEYIWVDCEHPSSSPPAPCNQGWQVSYRFRY